MGATTFFVKRKGQYQNARQAFIDAVQEAQYEYGHGGYTGTIAEKKSFSIIEVPNRKDPYVFAKECLENSEGKFWDAKWGPAACVEVKNSFLKKERGEYWKAKRNFKVFYFFGWASE